MKNVAFLGTGLLGGAMAERMLAQGHRVTVWNRTMAKARALEPLGARVADDPRQAIDGADRIHLALADDAAVDQVLDAIAPAVPAGAVTVDHSTTAPHRTRDRVARTARFVHAPVFMSPPMARAGKGLMMVSGAADVYDRVKDDLAQMTGEVWYVGEDGRLAASYKLFGNSMLFVIITGLSDVLAMAKGVGMPPLDAVKLFEKFQPGVAIPMRAEKMARGDFAAMFEMTMARKDAGLMLEAAGGVPLAVLPAVAAQMDEAIRAGHGKDDIAAVGFATRPQPEWKG